MTLLTNGDLSVAEEALHLVVGETREAGIGRVIAVVPNKVVV